MKIGSIWLGDRLRIVPGKGKIQKYKRWSQIYEVLEEPIKLKRDFINDKELMISDLGNIQNLLNGLWEKPIEELEKLFYKEKNEKLLSKFNISLYCK